MKLFSSNRAPKSYDVYEIQQQLNELKEEKAVRSIQSSQAGALILYKNEVIFQKTLSNLKLLSELAMLLSPENALSMMEREQVQTVFSDCHHDRHLKKIQAHFDNHLKLFNICSTLIKNIEIKKQIEQNTLLKSNDFHGNHVYHFNPIEQCFHRRTATDSNIKSSSAVECDKTKKPLSSAKQAALLKKHPAHQHTNSAPCILPYSHAYKSPERRFSEHADASYARYVVWLPSSASRKSSGI